MGMYDRDYYREEHGGFQLRMPQSAVGALIAINLAVYLADMLFGGKYHSITAALVLSPDALTRPWLWWKFLSYGFAHDWSSLGHIFGNMLALFFFGRDVEARYGTREFLRIYLSAIVLGGVVWALFEALAGKDGFVLGASGAVATIVILFALNFPRATILFFFIVPMPAWVLGVLFVVGDMLGFLGGRTPGEGPGVAYVIHLVGAAYAFLYFQADWNFGRALQGFSLSRLWPRPRLRVHTPEQEDADDEPPDAPPADLTAEVDRILEKISREGESSLSRKERQTLEEASRRYQRRRRE